MSVGDAMSVAALTVVAAMLATWLLSVRLRNASIVDVVWGLGFVAIAWAVVLRADGGPGRRWLLVVLVSVWGLRLAGHLFWRNQMRGGGEEDYRYRAMRKRWGSRFPLVSLVTVFALQGVLMWVVSLPVQLGQVPESPDVGWIGLVGVVVWVVGLAFESVGDLQLARFKSDPANSGKVMDRGLWRYTRHPNYFGDACAWWGVALVAVESDLAWSWRLVTLVGPVVMTILLMKVSGVALLERSLHKRKPDYEAYARRTSAFVPRPPRGS